MSNTSDRSKAIAKVTFKTTFRATARAKIVCMSLLLMGSGLWSACSSDDSQGATLLNVSYDPTRELYQEINARFAEEWKQKTGKAVTIR